MTTLDFVLLAILLIGGLNGLRLGLIQALANLVGWLFALVVAAKFTNTLAPSMTMFSQDPVVQKIMAFALIVICMVVLTWIVTALLNKILKTLKLGPLNRLAGGAFGTLKGLLVVLITMQGIGPWVEGSSHWKNSKVIQTLLPYAPWATEFSKDIAQQAYAGVKSAPEGQRKELLNQSNDQDDTSSSSHSTKNPFY